MARNPAVLGIVGRSTHLRALDDPRPQRGPRRAGRPVSPTNSDPELVRDDPDNPEDVLRELTRPASAATRASIQPMTTSTRRERCSRSATGTAASCSSRIASSGARAPGGSGSEAAERTGLKITEEISWSAGGEELPGEWPSAVRASGVRAVYINSSVPWASARSSASCARSSIGRHAHRQPGLHAGLRALRGRGGRGERGDHDLARPDRGRPSGSGAAASCGSSGRPCRATA
jgi:hypothetical protein